MKRTIFLLFVATFALLSGCASVPMASLDEDRQAKMFAPSPGQATIYLYRNESLGGAITMPVSLDDRIMGRTAPKTYFVWRVAPGKHEVASHTENTAKIVIDTRAGENYYIWQEVKWGMWAPRSQLHEVETEKAQKAIKGCKLADSKQ